MGVQEGTDIKKIIRKFKKKQFYPLFINGIGS